MPDRDYPDPREEDIVYGDRRLSRPDVSLPDWHIPDAKYRPIPIAWFAAAFLMQMAILTIIFALLSGKNGWLTIVLCALITGTLGKWTWERGMKDAGGIWQTATMAMMALQLAFVCLGAGARI